jgi:hypothetical protein
MPGALPDGYKRRLRQRNDGRIITGSGRGVKMTDNPLPQISYDTNADEFTLTTTQKIHPENLKDLHAVIGCSIKDRKLIKYPEAPDENTAFKIIESIPDKNGIIIIGIKEDPEGAFVSREKALEYVKREHQIRISAAEKAHGRALYNMIELIEERKTTLEDATAEMQDCNAIMKANLNIQKYLHALQVLESIRTGEPIHDDSEDND